MKSVKLLILIMRINLLILALLLQACSLNKKVNHISIDKLNNHLYKIYKNVSSYNEISEETELKLIESVKYEAIKLCQNESNIKKINHNIGNMEVDIPSRGMKYIKSITAIINCKIKSDESLKYYSGNVSLESNKNMKFSVYGSDFENTKELKEKVKLILDKEFTICKDSNKDQKKEIEFKLIQLLDDTPYTFDESNNEMIEFLGYEVKAEWFCN